MHFILAVGKHVSCMHASINLRLIETSAPILPNLGLQRLLQGHVVLQNHEPRGHLLTSEKQGQSC